VTGTRALVAAALAALTGAGCAARQGARTVGAGNLELNASVGGPIFSNLGAPLPMPLAHLGGRYGLTDGTDLLAGFHATAAAYGVAGVDAGANVQLVRRRRGLAVAASGLVNLLVGTREGNVRAYPEVGVHADWELAARWRGLFGVDVLAQLDPPPGKPPVLAAPYVGVEHLWGGGRHGVVVQLGWISPWADSTSTIDYAPGDRGALALQIGYRRGVGR